MLCTTLPNPEGPGCLAVTLTSWLYYIFETSLPSTGSMVGDKIKPVVVGNEGREVSTMPDCAPRIGAKVAVGMGVGRECEVGKLEDQTVDIWVESGQYYTCLGG